MAVKWEKTEANVGVLEVEVDSEKFNDALDWAFRKVVKRVAVPGFRKGKVPRRLFEQRFGIESLYEEAVDYLLPQAYDSAVQESGIFPVDRPDVSVVQIEKGKPFIFKATVTVKPEVELGEYKGLEVQDKAFTPEDNALDEEIETIRRAHAEINVLEEGEVQKGDTVNIDFVGTVNGEPFEGGEAENYQLEIGSGLFVKGFEEQLEGMKPGEKRQVTITFPEDYHVKSLANQDATFQVKLHDIKRKVLREMTDEFVQEISEFQTVDEFVADVRKQLETRLENEHKAYLEQQVLEKVLENAKVDIPHAMIHHEVDRQISNFAQQLRMQQIDFDEYLEFTGMTKDELSERFHEPAEKTVRSELVLEAIAKSENLDASEEDIESELQQFAEQTNLELDRVRQLMSMRDPGLMGLRHDIQNRKTVAFLVEHSKIV